MIDKSQIGKFPKPPHANDHAPRSDHFAMEERIYFAALALQNVQELNARADSKAYLVLTANGFLIAFLGVAAPNIKIVWQHGLTVGSALHGIATTTLILAVAVSLFHAFRIISPRLRQHKESALPSADGHQAHSANLMFFMDIIRAHHTDEDYTHALLDAPPEELLASLSSSVYGASISAQEKYREAHRSVRALGAVLIAWVSFVLLTLVLQ